MQVRQRNILLDSIKIIAALFVIGLHCAFLYEYNKIAYQIFANGIFKIVIPLFFCISGFFLFDVFQKNAIKRWMIRVGILYGIWMLIYGYFWISFQDFNFVKTILKIAIGFNHLWYLNTLLLSGFALYKLQKKSNTLLIFSAVVLFFIGLCIQYLGHFDVFLEQPLLDKIAKYPVVHRNFLFYGLPFLSIGYVIRKTNFHKKLSKTKVLTLLLLSLVLLAIESLINYYFLSYTIVINMHLAFLVAGPALLITAFTFNISSRMDSKILSSYSIAIYLAHPWVIFFIISTCGLKLQPTVLTFTTILISLLLSYMLITLNKKVKYLL